MEFRSGSRARLSAPLVLAALLLAFMTTPALAQRVTVGGPGAGVTQEMLVTVVVSVRENGGMPIQGSAFVKLSSDFSGVHITAPTRDGGAATFPAVRAGEYVN
jgi:hypothetical protein